MEAFFGEFATRDIDHGTHKPHSIVRREESPAAGGNPTKLAIFHADRAVLNVVASGTFRIDGLFDGFICPVPIFGMEAGQE